MRKNKKKKYIGLGLLFLIGLSILLYPMVSDAWNRYRDSLLISNYSSSVSSDDNSEKIDSMWKAAQEYNEQIKQESVPDAFSVRDGQTDSTYESLLNLNGDGMMGYVEIPVIDVSIPIYHYTTDETLEKGAGHLFGSSLPVGGKSTHCILSAHRGLPNAKLFTDLDQMEKGDIFILHILGKHLAYKVDQIKTVLPDETSDLDIIEGEDHVTLITCTPYGVNTHRLLVRGVRTKYVVEDTKNDETIPQKLAVVDPKRVLAGGAAVLVVLILLIYLIVRHRDKKRKKKQLSERKEEAESDEK